MMQKNQRKVSNPRLLIAVGLFGVLVWIFCISLFVTKMQDQPYVPQKLNVHFVPEPTIIPSQKKGWNRYIYPDKKRGFSFEFPSNWHIKTEYKMKDLPTTTLSYKEQNQEYNIVINTLFAAEYRGNDISSKEEKRTINGRQIIINTIYERDKILGVVAYYDDFNISNDPIQTISIDLVQGDPEVPIKVFDHLLSSLKYE